MQYRVMVVDDEQNIREIISEMLTDAGYSVSLAVDGMDALEKIQYEQFDLYILDIYMPRMNGLELMVKLKELQPLAVVVVTTGFSSIDVAVKAIRNGAFHYLTKPIQAEELMKVVASGLEHKRELNEAGGQAAEIQTETTESMLLRGFSPEQIREFKSVGSFASYKKGDTILLTDDPGAMIWVENGRISVEYNGNLIDTLKAGDIWGEESFINTGTGFTSLIVQQDSQVRHFSRRKLIEFFTYQDETLTKRYMINLIQSVYVKWRRAIFKLGLYSGFSPGK